MISVELKPLLGKLDDVATRALNLAAALCVTRGHYELTVEHALHEMINDKEGDLPVILARFDVNVARLSRSLDAALDDFRTGNPGKPALSPLLVEWISDAWMLASVELGASSIRSGILLLALVARPRRYLSMDVPELERVRFDELKRSFGEVVRQSPEGAPPPAASKQTALARFASDLTAAAAAGKIDPVFGRDREIRQLIDILARRRKNNPIIVGEAGVGKTAVAEGLALRVALGDVPDPLKGVALWSLDLGLLQAGAGVKGEFENRLKAVIEEVKSSARPVILFIDEAHTLIGAGSAPGTSDAANLLKPALARGELRTIAATTWAEYKKYFEEDAALARRFQPVIIDEPSVSDAMVMLRGIKGKYEEAHGVTVRDDAIEAAAKLSARYMSGRLLPDKAVDLLDTTAARVRVGLTAKPPPIDELSRAIEARERELAAAERDRKGGVRVDDERIRRLSGRLVEDRSKLATLTDRWRAQQNAVLRVQTLRAANATDAEISDALGALATLQGSDPLVRLGDAEVVAQVVGDWTGVPVGRMVQSDAAQILEVEARLAERIKGQDEALATVSSALRGAKAGLHDPNKPQVFLLVGPSGVGKTELGLTVADVLFGGERFVVTINMSEYQDREMGVSGLIGAKPGYVGYGKGGTLTEAVRHRPYSVVLLDEIEKSCQEVRNLFYQVFDKGELTDGTGRRIDFKNTVIFLTTNLTGEIIQSLCRDERPPIGDVLSAIRPSLSAALMPAWLARTTVVPFLPLDRSVLATITEMKLRELSRRLRDAHDIELVVDASVVSQIAERCAEVETGARNIDFILQGTLLPMLSRLIITRLGSSERSRARLAVTRDASKELRADFAE
jgi:type VI secretion system protein VasG